MVFPKTKRSYVQTNLVRGGTKFSIPPGPSFVNAESMARMASSESYFRADLGWAGG